MNEKYYNHIDRLFKRVQVLDAKQLYAYIKATTPLDDDNTMYLIKQMMLKLRILCSPDGYFTTRSSLLNVSDNYEKLTDLKAELTMDLNPSVEWLSRIDCFWAVLQYLPDSDRFVSGIYPYYYMFTDAKNNRIVQIAHIPYNKEEITSELICNMEQPSKEDRQYYRRIAIIDNEKAVNKVKRCGFSHICIINDEMDSHIEVIESREGDLWSDVYEQNRTDK